MTMLAFVPQSSFGIDGDTVHAPLPVELRDRNRQTDRRTLDMGEELDR